MIGDRPRRGGQKDNDMTTATWDYKEHNRSGNISGGGLHTAVGGTSCEMRCQTGRSLLFIDSRKIKNKHNKTYCGCEHSNLPTNTLFNNIIYQHKSWSNFTFQFCVYYHNSSCRHITTHKIINPILNLKFIYQEYDQNKISLPKHQSL